MKEFELIWDVTEDEIRAWMDSEIARLGKLFDNFTITWHRDENYHWVEIWCNTICPEKTHIYGELLRVVETLDPDGLSLPIIQQAGRKLYYKLRKDYPVNRELGK